MRAPGPAAAMPGGERPLGGLDHGEALRGPRLADDEADRRVGGDAAEGDGEVEREQVAVGQRVVVGQAVQHGVVDGRCRCSGRRARGRTTARSRRSRTRHRHPRSSPSSTGRSRAGSCPTSCGACSVCRMSATSAPVSCARRSSVGVRISIMRPPSVATNNYPGHDYPGTSMGTMVRLPLTPAELERGERLGALLRRARGERSMLDVALDCRRLAGDAAQDRVRPGRDARLLDDRGDRGRPRPLARRGLGRDPPHPEPQRNIRLRSRWS